MLHTSVQSTSGPRAAALIPSLFLMIGKLKDPFSSSQTPDSAWDDELSTQIKKRLAFAFSCFSLFSLQDTITALDLEPLCQVFAF
jgi:hypothetical protein